MTIAATKDLSLAQRLEFYSRSAPNGCREWTGDINAGGYGRLYWAGKPRSAHRLAWEASRGGPPREGAFVCHHCDNRRCIEPSHLFLGSPKDNTQDMLRKNRDARGERNGLAKLTHEHVRAIRAATGTREQIASGFSIHPSTVGLIKSRRRWGHIK